MTFSSLLSASKLSGVMLLMFSLGACREEAPASASNDPSATGLSSKIGENPDPDLEVVPEGESINEVDCSVLHAAKLYEEYSGKRVIMTHEIAKTEISFNMSGPLTNREAERFLQLTLLAEGIAMIPIPEEEDIVRLVAAAPITTLGPPRTEFFTDVSELPEEDELVLFQMIFEHLKPEDALEVLQAELGQFSASGTIEAVPNASSLIITEKVSFVKKMIEIQEKIDLPLTSSDQPTKPKG